MELFPPYRLGSSTDISLRLNDVRFERRHLFAQPDVRSCGKEASKPYKKGCVPTDYAD
jgi:hypothetical protein